MILTAEEKIRKVRIKLNQDNPFFGFLSMNLTLKKFPKELEEQIKSSNCMPTMAVDSKGNLYYDEGFIDSLSTGTLTTVVTHEVMHLVFSHIFRGGYRKKESMDIWNIATDICVNGFLQDNGFDFGNLRAKSIIPDEVGTFTYGKIVIKDCMKKTAEELYDEIYKQAKKNDMLQEVEGYGQGMGFDNHLPDDGQGTPEERQKTENEWKKKVSEANTMSQMAGKELKGMERAIEDLLNPKIAWKERLQKYITQQIISDYTYRKPSRRSIPLGVYLPSSIKESLDLICALDVSGSISQDELREFVTEIVSISNSFEQVNLTIITHENEIKDIFELRNSNESDILNLKIRGGGGTSFSCITEHMEEIRYNNPILVWLTDGYAEPVEKQNYPILWVLTKYGTDEAIKESGEVIKLE